MGGWQRKRAFQAGGTACAKQGSKSSGSRQVICATGIEKGMWQQRRLETKQVQVLICQVMSSDSTLKKRATPGIFSAGLGLRFSQLLEWQPGN